MDPSPATDQELLAQHVAGSPRAFGELVDRHGDRMWAIALRTIGNPDDAADAVQEAWLSAHRAAASFRGSAAVTTWLHRIVVNACLDIARRRAARPADPLPELPDRPGPDPVVEHESAQGLLAALRTLPIDAAAAVVLVDVEGYSVAEAADLLGVPVGTVKSRCSRARARLAETLHEGGVTATRNATGGTPVQPVPTDDEGPV